MNHLSEELCRIGIKQYKIAVIKDASFGAHSNEVKLALASPFQQAACFKDDQTNHFNAVLPNWLCMNISESMDSPTTAISTNQVLYITYNTITCRSSERSAFQQRTALQDFQIKHQVNN